LSKIVAVDKKPLRRFLESFSERGFGLKAKEFLGPAEIVYGLHGFDRFTIFWLFLHGTFAPH
jgi:hypothetical protein